MADQTVHSEDAKARAEALAKARVEAQAAANKRLDEDDKARVERNAEAEKRRTQAKPTPTQREADLAKLGLLDIDSKEDDGSGPEVMPAHVRRAAVADEEAVQRYKTREAKPETRPAEAKPKVI